MLSVYFGQFQVFRIFFSNAECDYIVKTPTGHARTTSTSECMIPDAMQAAKQVAAVPISLRQPISGGKCHADMGRVTRHVASRGQTHSRKLVQ